LAVEVIRSVAAMRRLSSKWRVQGSRVALVPTMGYLHDGHLSLIGHAWATADRCAVSIFVNPAQFGPKEDLARYPRDFERDRGMCERVGVNAIFAPEAEELYPPGYQTWVEAADLSRPLCGASRPGHFRGVATVVCKLLNIVRPHVAVFGLKDYQQFVVIRRVARDLDLEVEISGRPIVREPDGLAMSSRNSYLSPKERRQALCLSEALDVAARLYAAGEHDSARIVAAAREVIGKRPLARIDYVELRDAETLEEVSEVQVPAVLALAVWIGKTRLIDNALLGGEDLPGGVS
jgi:pantoate--beta-alanine ligase